MEGRDKTRMTIRIIAGAYLAYLGIQLFQSMNSEEGNKILFIVIAVLFVACGALFAISGVKGMTNIRKLEAEGYYDEDDEDEDTAEDAAEDAEVIDADPADYIEVADEDNKTEA